MANEIQYNPKLSREKFTELIDDVIVSATYYEFIYRSYFERLIEAGMPIEHVVQSWINNNKSSLIELNIQGKIKFFEDDGGICLNGEDEHNAFDIVNHMAEENFRLLDNRDKLYSAICDLDVSFKEIRKISENSLKLGEIFTKAYMLLFNKFKYEIVSNGNLFNELMAIFESYTNCDYGSISADQYKKAILIGDEE